jgi:hypothetical protein
MSGMEQGYSNREGKWGSARRIHSWTDWAFKAGFLLAVDVGSKVKFAISTLQGENIERP